MQDPLQASLVEREGTLKKLQALALTAAPAPVWLVGPAGSGKTRVLGALAARLKRGERQVFEVCGRGQEGPPYAAVAPLLQALGVELGGAAGTSVWAEGAHARLQLHAAVCTALAAIATPLAWLVDEAEGLDEASRALLEVLERARQDAFWLHAAREAPPGSRTLALAPLSRDGAHALAAALLDGALPDALSAPLAALASGLPGRVVHLVAHWQRLGLLQRDADGWQADAETDALLPDVAWTPEGRLATLSREALQLGALAALWDGAPTRTVLQSTGDAARALRELNEAGVLHWQGERYQLAGGATALALLAAVGAAGRKALHAHCFRLLAEGRPDAARGLTALWPVARHGALGEAWPAARPWVLAGAQAALALHEIAAAAPLLQALATAPADPQRADDERLANVQVLRARGDVAAARQLLDDALLQRLLARAEPDGADHLTTAGVLALLAGDAASAAARFEAALVLATQRAHPPSAIRAWLFQGRTAYFGGDTARAGRCFEAAMALTADPAGAPLRGWALGLWGHWLTLEAARAEQGLALLAEAVALNQATGRVYWQHEALNNMGDALLAGDRPAEAATVFAQSLALTLRYGLAAETVFARINLANTAAARGDWREAAEQGHRALTESRQQARRYPEGLALAVLGLAQVFTGAPAAGLAHLQAAAELAAAIGNQALGLTVASQQAEAWVELGCWERGRLALADARTRAALTGLVDQQPRLGRVALALAAATQPAEAEILCAAALAAAPTASSADAWLWRASNLQGGLADEAIAKAQALALTHGLVGVEVRLGLLQGLLPGSSLDALAQAGELARRSGHAARAAVADVERGRRLPDAALRREGARRLRELAAELDEPTARAFLAAPLRAHAVQREAWSEDAGAWPQGAWSATDEPLRQALLIVIEAVDADSGVALSYDGLEISQVVAAGGTPGLLDGARAELAHRCRFLGQPIYLADARLELATAEFGFAAALPIEQDGACLAVLLATRRQAGSPPAERERARLAALARQLAGVLAAHHGRAEALAALAAQTRVQAATLAALAAPDDEAALGALLAAARAAAGAQVAYLLDAASLETLAMDEAPDELAPEAPPELALCAWAIAEQQWVVTPGLDEGETLWLVPALHAQAIYGLLVLVGRRQSPPERATLEGLAALVGVWLARQRR